ncbi:hypothetical protein DPMN_062881 [Dreissena polymorpha]|uniref:Uncharacterized protein n=1 Tax=Dreissena polymorpha TaxID=45954 RepID=A0A9D4CAB7_DREPO|nr:hypothetical protein DPMN_062881 [Dreissena polymorpha]
MATKTKRTISLLSNPEQGGEQKKHRMLSDSNCEFNYTVESEADIENVDTVVLDTNTLLANSQTVQESIQKSLAVEMNKMVESIISGVVDGLTKELTSWKMKTKHSVMRNACDPVVEIENLLDTDGQYSRRNSLRIFGIPEGNEAR